MERYDYAPLYCEENVRRLMDHPDVAGSERNVLFIARDFRMWAQRAGSPCTWDYHVILLVKSAGWRVWDLDSLLGLDAPLETYLDRSFKAPGPRFRVIDAATFATTFSSDRSHMKLPDGTYRAPPPPWPPCFDPARGMNLNAFIDMDQPFVGERLDLPGLRALS